jgi:chromatin assembly factor 1 subunit B
MLLFVSRLPYRIVFAVVTKDSIVFYDSQRSLPFAYVDNVHYSNLTDLSWFAFYILHQWCLVYRSPDGRVVLISSTDGYCSFILFDDTDFGSAPCLNIAEAPPSPKLITIKTPKRVRKTTQCNSGIEFKSGDDGGGT